MHELYNNYSDCHFMIQLLNILCRINYFLYFVYIKLIKFIFFIYSYLYDCIYSPSRRILFSVHFFSTLKSFQPPKVAEDFFPRGSFSSLSAKFSLSATLNPLLLLSGPSAITKGLFLLYS